MTNTKQVMQQALEALRLPCDRWNGQQTKMVNAAIEALSAALTAPAAEVPEAMPADWFAGMPEQYRTEAWRIASTRLRGGVPEVWQFRVLSPGSITVQTESGYSCTLWKSGHGGVEALAYQMADMLRKSLTAAPQAPAPEQDAGVRWFTVAEDGMPDVGEEVIGGLWYTDPWLKPELATRFMWGLCRVFKSDHRDCKDGKAWQTFGPPHSDITHWARLNRPAMSAQGGA